TGTAGPGPPARRAERRHADRCGASRSRRPARPALQGAAGYPAHLRRRRPRRRRRVARRGRGGARPADSRLHGGRRQRRRAEPDPGARRPPAFPGQGGADAAGGETVAGDRPPDARDVHAGANAAAAPGGTLPRPDRARAGARGDRGYLADVPATLRLVHGPRAGPASGGNVARLGPAPSAEGIVMNAKRFAPLGWMVIAVLALLGAGPAADPEGLVRQGNAAFARRDSAAALDRYTRAEDRIVDPGLVAFNKATAFFRVGAATEEPARRAGLYREAELHYRRALEDAAGQRQLGALYGLGTSLV